MSLIRRHKTTSFLRSGQYSPKVSIFAPRRSCPEFDSRHYDFFFCGNFDVGEVDQQHYFIESRQQRLTNVDETHQALANGKLAQQKKVFLRHLNHRVSLKNALHRICRDNMNAKSVCSAEHF